MASSSVYPQDDVDMKDLLSVDSTTTLPFFRAGVEARTGAGNGKARRCGAGGTSEQAGVRLFSSAMSLSQYWVLEVEYVMWCSITVSVPELKNR